MGEISAASRADCESGTRLAQRVTPVSGVVVNIGASFDNDLLSFQLREAKMGRQRFQSVQFGMKIGEEEC
jgi:hypothetical protein